MNEKDLKDYFNVIFDNDRRKRVSVLVISHLKGKDLCSLKQKLKLKIYQMSPTYDAMRNHTKKYDYVICDLSYGANMDAVIMCLCQVLEDGGRVYLNYLQSSVRNIHIVKNEWAFSTGYVNAVFGVNDVKILESKKKGNRVFLSVDVGECNWM